MLKINSIFYRYSGIFAVVLTYATIFVSVSLYPSFSWVDNALSDLGVYPRTAIIFNLGIIFAGVLIVVFALSIKRKYDSQLWHFGSLLLMITGVFLALVGVFPENWGFLHVFVALIFFVAYGLAVFILGLSIRKNMRFLGLLGMLSGIWLLCVWIFAGLLGIRGLALPEVLSTVLPNMWMVIFSIRDFLGE